MIWNNYATQAIFFLRIVRVDIDFQRFWTKFSLSWIFSVPLWSPVGSPPHNLCDGWLTRSIPNLVSHPSHLDPKSWCPPLHSEGTLCFSTRGQIIIKWGLGYLSIINKWRFNNASIKRQGFGNSNKSNSSCSNQLLFKEFSY